jgi:hypothetical protein
MISSLSMTSCANTISFDEEIADFYTGTIYDNEQDALNQPGPA